MRHAKLPFLLSKSNLWRTSNLCGLLSFLGASVPYAVCEDEGVWLRIEAKGTSSRRGDRSGELMRRGKMKEPSGNHMRPAITP